MRLLDSPEFAFGIIVLALSIFLFAGLTVAASYCNPNADFTTAFCTNRTLPWLPLLGLPFGVFMVAYPFLKKRQAASTTQPES